MQCNNRFFNGGIIIWNILKKCIAKGKTNAEFLSDKRSSGLGALRNNIRTGGQFSLEEMFYHINVMKY